MPDTGTTGTTSQADEVCIGAICVDVQNVLQTPTNSFSEVTQRSSGTPDLIALDRVVSSTGTYSTSVTWTGPAPIEWHSAGAIITLKAASSVSRRRSVVSFLT